MMERAENATISRVERVGEDTEDTLYRKVTLRLLPILLACYTISYLDRINISFAKIPMNAELNFSEAVYGLGAGLFFIGYALAEVPSNLMLHRFGARRWLARILFTWGCISMAMLFVYSELSFYFLRIMLGIGEAGLFPGVIFYLLNWYPAHRRARITSLLYLAAPFAGVLGAPVSAFIIAGTHGALGMSGWQWMFLLEGLPAVLMALVVFKWLTNSIEEASWLSPSEKKTLRGNLNTEDLRKHDIDFRAIFSDKGVLLLAGILFGIVLSQTGVFFYMPSLIRNAGVTDTIELGILSAVPYGAAVVVMLLVNRHSDNVGERRWHLFASCVLGISGFIVSTVFKANIVLVVLGMSMAISGVMASLPVFWTLPTAMLKGKAAATGIAFVNSIGLTAGFVAPFIIGYLTTMTGSPDTGIYLVAVVWTVTALIALMYVKPKIV
ncbi:MFS transporter [Rhizobium lentis]|uniref:MFS transporter n=1 Tax=Rhizobium lentis TaxID=1138194 RepID=UPI001C82F17D|nr:MFS transporter [Rhizobium lentis]MBX5101319.1 MFS transporter [Rhizobium lentis]